MRIAPPDVIAARVTRLRRELAREGTASLLATSLPNVAYLTGFFASAAALLVTPDQVILVGDGRYREELAARADDCEFITVREVVPGLGYDEVVAQLLRTLQGSAVAFEADHLTVSRHQWLLNQLDSEEGCPRLVARRGTVEALRVVKDPWEVACLREGGTRLSDVAKCIIPKVLEGRTEAEVAGDVDLALRRAGFERPSFDTIVASGPNAARPHGRPTERRLEAGDLVVIDFGGVLNGYCTDLTRTVGVGRLDGFKRRLLEEVAEAQRAAFAHVGPGRAPEDVDEAARAVLTRYGKADAFTHGTGHGLGLEVHEAPRVTRRRSDRAEPLLAAGMVMTLEPGVYLPGQCGARIEDDVVVTEDGREWLTEAEVA